ncbi:MAG TPA: hypothetical protein VMB53_16870 [Gaiellaceae bacterium]|nr:hypothetical protein [Gaiellaceae bacterium]
MKVWQLLLALGVVAVSAALAVTHAGGEAQPVPPTAAATPTPTTTTPATPNAPTATDVRLVEQATYLKIDAPSSCFTSVNVQFSATPGWAVVETKSVFPRPAECAWPGGDPTAWLQRMPAGWTVIRWGTALGCPSPAPADISACPPSQSGIADGTVTTTTVAPTQQQDNDAVQAVMKQMLAHPPTALPSPTIVVDCYEIGTIAVVSSAPVFGCTYGDAEDDQRYGCFTPFNGSVSNLVDVTAAVGRLPVHLVCQGE